MSHGTGNYSTLTNVTRMLNRCKPCTFSNDVGHGSDTCKRRRSRVLVVEWMCDGCKVYMDSYVASNGSCFKVTWTILKNRLLHLGLTQNQETMALWTLITVGLFYCIMCEDSHKQKVIEIAFGWGPRHIWLHTTLEDPWPHHMILVVCWNGLWKLFFWALTISWSWLLARMWCGPNIRGSHTASENESFYENEKLLRILKSQSGDVIHGSVVTPLGAVFGMENESLRIIYWIYWLYRHWSR